MLAAAAAAIQGEALCQSALNLSPSRVVGQPSLTFRSASPNVVEGREFWNPSAVVVDRTTSPPSLYVSDLRNNRVLGWRDARGFQNGAPADIVVGQPDFTSTTALGPGTSRATGLSSPGALAVDGNGNLYVVDSGNNRILRYPKPFSVPEDLRLPDMVIGQPNFNVETANTGGVSEKTLAINSGSTLGLTGLAFDREGNLWATDPLNHRVLRYPRSALEQGRNQPAADLVLGQNSFTTVTAPDSNRLNKSTLRTPGGVAVDSDGRIYVSDSNARVLVFAPPLFNGKEAARILGVSARPPAQPLLNEYALSGPEGLTILDGNRLAVADPALNRVLIYDPPSDWPAEAEDQPPSPPARAVLGQTGFRDVQSNRGLAEPNETTLSGPLAVHFWNGELFVADTQNNRVVVFPTQGTGASASRVLGQPTFNLNAANIADDAGLFLFNGLGSAAGVSLSDGAGIAIDHSTGVPRLYIADTYNNRVLGYADARKVRPGVKADTVIGQNDFSRVLVNAPFGDRDSLNDTGLFRPSGLAVDKNGDLFVADSGNGRVLRFPKPFEQNVAPNERRRANLVLGQLSFNQRIIDATARTMAYPFGLAFTGEGHLVVSDAVHSRLLFFRRPASGDFTNGQAAERVIGQPDFTSAGRGNAPNRMSSPRHIAIDTDDRLYVVDAGNNRVLVYNRITVGGNDPTPAFILTGLNSPHGIFVSALTGEIWVANTLANRATRFPRYERLAIDSRSDYDIPSNVPLAVTQDAYGNLYVAEASNRIAIYFNALRFQVAGNFASRPLSPGTWAVLTPAGAGVQFSDRAVVFDETPRPVPMPTEIADVQVLVNDIPAPLYYVSPLQINFLVPMRAPSSGTGEIVVVKPSTGQVIGAGTVAFDAVSPALFVVGGGASGQVAALNQDNTINSASNPIPKGQVIQMFGTGQGFIPNAPPDGVPAEGQIPIVEQPLKVLIGTDFVADSDILYSGLAPGLIGVWQINVRIPDRVAPGNAVPVVVQLRDVNSNIQNPASSQRLSTTIAVRP